MKKKSELFYKLAEREKVVEYIFCDNETFEPLYSQRELDEYIEWNGYLIDANQTYFKLTFDSRLERRVILNAIFPDEKKRII